jgi:putative metalloprotease
MGHIVKNHLGKKIRLAYATSAVRKGIASLRNMAGEVASSQLGNLAESLMNAQFSQLGKKEADDYGLAFLKEKKLNPLDAVSALKNLALLGQDHSFLSSHPDPGKRAERLQAQLEGKAWSIEENQQNILARVKAFLEIRFQSLYKQLAKFLP